MATILYTPSDAAGVLNAHALDAGPHSPPAASAGSNAEAAAQAAVAKGLSPSPMQLGYVRDCVRVLQQQGGGVQGDGWLLQLPVAAGLAQSVDAARQAQAPGGSEQQELQTKLPLQQQGHQAHPAWQYRTAAPTLQGENQASCPMGLRWGDGDQHMQQDQHQ
eukprot:scaffold103933_cov19-Tisochrysis_lutea.AAC.1